MWSIRAGAAVRPDFMRRGCRSDAFQARPFFIWTMQWSPITITTLLITQRARSLAGRARSRFSLSGISATRICGRTGSAGPHICAGLRCALLWRQAYRIRAICSRSVPLLPDSCRTGCKRHQQGVFSSTRS